MPVHSQIPPVLLSLTQIVLLNIADVAVDGRVAKNDQHNSVAPFCLDAVCRMTLHCINLGRLDHNRVSPLPRPTWHVEHPQFICHIPSAAFQFPAKHVDLILQRNVFFSFYSVLGEDDATCHKALANKSAVVAPKSCAYLVGGQ